LVPEFVSFVAIHDIKVVASHGGVSFSG